MKAATAISWATALSAGSVKGDVDLVLVPNPPTVTMGSIVEIGLHAVSDTGIDQTIAAMDVVLTWDSDALRLVGFVDNGPNRWLMSGFLGDSALDGLNDSLLDGDATYTALSGLGTPARATPQGLLVTTFRFQAIAASESAPIVIEATLGDFSVTRVFGADHTNQVVTGDLGQTMVTVLGAARITAPDLVVPRGQVTDLVVFGEIADLATLGVTVVMELVPDGDAVGIVEFTAAPPVDIVQLDDPWPGSGLFSWFDTDVSGSAMLNGIVDDNGKLLPSPVTFSGALAAFPVRVSDDAVGVWEVRLTVSGTDSSWEEATTILEHGRLRPVDAGDGNGDEAVDMADYAGFQRCFSGNAQPEGGRPAYAIDAELHCAVYDMDGDHDVDLDDYGLFRERVSGPE